eukprot:TRINITY_DN294_c0_g1_i1.p1 TRINITY_DN294_c0_g1~~TRINITY_DN294_c0_g1_i1.p1  ORF type:complete len:229 (+),score=43.17 TRINITY_DN294_c0_g1_i1:268-954(+)
MAAPATFAPDSQADFDAFVQACDSTEGWKVVHEEAKCKVWEQKSGNSAINIIRVWTKFDTVEPLLLYDVLHDPEYRATWDDHMVEGYNIEQIDVNNDVGYYSAKGMGPVSGRDFVNQRAWRVKGDEYIIKNHSVIHPKQPEKKGFVRAWSYMTGYLIRKNPEGPGCTLTYYTQTDPKGWIPTALVNKVTKSFAPQNIQKLELHASKYEAWKAEHKPDNKPWRAGGGGN